MAVAGKNGPYIEDMVLSSLVINNKRNNFHNLYKLESNPKCHKVEETVPPVRVGVYYSMRLFCTFYAKT